MFKNRRDAGIQVGDELRRRGYRGATILGIPNGGAEVAVFAATRCESRVHLVVCRKLPFPHNPESGFGAVAEDGSKVILEGPAAEVRAAERARIAEEQQREIRRRIQILRGGEELADIAGATVVLTDDGIAMGSTMRAAIRLCRNRNAGHLTVAVPVASPTARAQLEPLVDEIVVMEEPPRFRAVAQVYEQWYDVSDAEVRELMGISGTEHS
jgi:predicted phosphoribosyltransferase